MQRTHPEARGSDLIGQRLSRRGLRLTVQRRRVFELLCDELDHPTAEEVFLRAKRRMPQISLATVYNCLEALVQCGLARRVSVDPAARRFCPNMDEHSHFLCERCGGIFDVALGAGARPDVVALPRGFRARGMDVSIRGLCADCSRRGSDVGRGVS